jgi:hypothetical protein
MNMNPTPELQLTACDIHALPSTVNDTPAFPATVNYNPAFPATVNDRTVETFGISNVSKPSI